MVRPEGTRPYRGRHHATRYRHLRPELRQGFQPAFFLEEEARFCSGEPIF